MSRMTRRALFVGGPWHGTIRDLPDPAPIGFDVVELGPGADPESTEYRTRRYQRNRFMTRETDGTAAVEMWTYDDVSLIDPMSYQQAADAAVRVLIRAGELPYRFTEAPASWPREVDPALAARERCTPNPAERAAATLRSAEELRAAEQVQRMLNAGIPRALIRTDDGEPD